MRVLIDYRPALRQRTGVGEYTHQLAAALVPRLQPDGAVVLFSSSWRDRLPPARVPGAVPIDVPVPVRVLNWAWHRLERPRVEAFAGPIDIAHSMHPLLIPTRRAARVVTIHDLYFLDHPESTTAEIRRDYAPLVHSHARRADCVVVVSKSTASQVRERLGVPDDRIVLCPPGAPDWQPRPDPPANGPILFVGTIEARKNVDGLLRAYGQLVATAPGTPDLVLAGRAGAGGDATLDRLRASPYASRVRHLGYVDDEHRQRLYREASVLVLPSLEEGFGMPALEAMTVGVPVVAANRGALPEVVGDAGLLVDPLDAGAIAGAIERLLRDRALAARCADLGIQRSRLFSWSASADRLLQAYRLVLRSRTARRA